jgi:hypothetical protein
MKIFNLALTCVYFCLVLLVSLSSASLKAAQKDAPIFNSIDSGTYALRGGDVTPEGSRSIEIQRERIVVTHVNGDCVIKDSAKVLKAQDNYVQAQLESRSVVNCDAEEFAETRVDRPYDDDTINLASRLVKTIFVSKDGVQVILRSGWTEYSLTAIEE